MDGGHESLGCGSAGSIDDIGPIAMGVNHFYFQIPAQSADHGPLTVVASLRNLENVLRSSRGRIEREGIHLSACVENGDHVALMAPRGKTVRQRGNDALQAPEGGGGYDVRDA
jgi:hypothetical protein